MPSVNSHRENQPHLQYITPSVSAVVDPQLVANFLRSSEAAKGSLDPERMSETAQSFLAHESNAYKECKQTAGVLDVAVAELKPLQTQLREAQVDACARVSSPNLPRLLDDISCKMQPIRALCGIPDPIQPSADDLYAESERLAQILHTKKASHQSTLRSICQHLVDAARISLRTADEQRITSQLRDYLKQYSTYYPRRISPEASALECGLLALGGDDSPKNTAGFYALAEKHATPSGTTTLPSGLQKLPSFPANSFFGRLTQLKKELAAASASNGDTSRIAKDLLALYEASGSPALAYFAALDCIETGDTSHRILFKATQHAEAAGVLSQFQSYLLNRLKNNPSQSALQLQAFLVSKKLRDTIQVDQALNALPEGCNERAFVYAVLEHLNAQGSVTNRAEKIRSCASKAFSCFSITRKGDQNETRLAQESLGLLLLSHRELRLLGNDKSREIANTSMLQLTLDPESALGWEMALQPLFEASPMSARAWKEVDDLLFKIKGVCGFITAGHKALELAALARQAGQTSEATSLANRAEGYFKEACSIEAKHLGVEGLIAMASLAELQGNTSQALAHLAAATSRAPHDARLRPLQVAPVSNTNADDGLKADDPSSGLQPNLWPPETRKTIADAIRAGKNNIDVTLSQKDPNYAVLSKQLAHGSDLFNLQQTADKMVKQIASTLETLLQQNAISQRDWEKATANRNLYEVLNPNATTPGVGPYFALLDLCKHCATTLDPSGYFLELGDASEALKKVAMDAQRDFFCCTTDIAKANPSHRESVIRLKEALESTKSIISEKVTPKLLAARAGLKRWAEEVALLDPNALEALESHKEGEIARTNTSTLQAQSQTLVLG